MNLYKGPNGEVVEVVYPENEAVDITINGEPAVLLEADTTDAALEKHVPAVKVEDDKLKVQIGETKHPMLDKHFITNIWVEYPDGTVEKTSLLPGEEPVAEFDIKDQHGTVKVYEYCNIHGLWKKEIEL